MALRLFQIGVLALLAGLTSCQQSRFSSDLTLWKSAINTNPQLARPYFNYGVALRMDGSPNIAAESFALAAAHADGTPQAAEYRALVKDQLRLIEAFGEPVCEWSAVQPYCY